MPFGDRCGCRRAHTQPPSAASAAARLSDSRPRPLVPPADTAPARRNGEDQHDEVEQGNAHLAVETLDDRPHQQQHRVADEPGPYQPPPPALQARPWPRALPEHVLSPGHGGRTKVQGDLLALLHRLLHADDVDPTGPVRPGHRQGRIDRAPTVAGLRQPPPGGQGQQR